MMNIRNRSTSGIKENAGPRTVSWLPAFATFLIMVALLITGCVPPRATPTSTPKPRPTALPTAVLDVDDHLARLIDRYYSCINFANPEDESAYEECWNYLSGEPGQYQSSFSLEQFKEFWKPYSVAYVLYYCPREGEHFIVAETYLLALEDISLKIIDPHKFVMEYSFADDGEGWKIKSGTPIDEELPASCEARPRIRRLALPY